jgi:hypothetical protein
MRCDFQIAGASQTPMILPFALLALAALQQQPPISNPCAAGYTENVWDPRFTPGQHWSYHARPIDKDSTLFITKIDYVPELGVVLQILVDHVDFEDKPGDRPINNYRRESMAIRRDSLDSSVLTLLGIIGTTGSPANYGLWTKNCGGLTYATTVADTLKTLQDAYIDQQFTCTTPIILTPAPSGKPEKFTLSLSQRIHDLLLQETSEARSSPSTWLLSKVDKSKSSGTLQNNRTSRASVCVRRRTTEEHLHYPL